MPWSVSTFPSQPLLPVPTKQFSPPLPSPPLSSPPLLPHLMSQARSLEQRLVELLLPDLSVLAAQRLVQQVVVAVRCSGHQRAAKNGNETLLGTVMVSNCSFLLKMTKAMVVSNIQARPKIARASAMKFTSGVRSTRTWTWVVRETCQVHQDAYRTWHVASEWNVRQRPFTCDVSITWDVRCDKYVRRHMTLDVRSTWDVPAHVDVAQSQRTNVHYLRHSLRSTDSAKQEQTNGVNARVCACVRVCVCACVYPFSESILSIGWCWAWKQLQLSSLRRLRLQSLRQYETIENAQKQQRVFEIPTWPQQILPSFFHFHLWRPPFCWESRPTHLGYVSPTLLRSAPGSPQQDSLDPSGIIRSLERQISLMSVFTREFLQWVCSHIFVLCDECICACSTLGCAAQPAHTKKASCQKLRLRLMGGGWEGRFTGTPDKLSTNKGPVSNCVRNAFCWVPGRSGWETKWGKRTHHKIYLQVNHNAPEIGENSDAHLNPGNARRTWWRDQHSSVVPVRTWNKSFSLARKPWK